MIHRILVAMALLCASAPTFAQSCATPGGWTKPSRHVAGRTPNLRFAVKPGSSAQLQLHAEPSVAMPIKKDRATHGKEFAGLAALDVSKPGKLEVALSHRAYVDLIRDGKPLQSMAAGRKECRGMFKAVTFETTPGRYIVQIAHAKVRSIRIGFRPL